MTQPANENRRQAMVCPDIQRWLPTRWDQFLGNRTIVRYLKRLLRRYVGDFQAGKIPELGLFSFLLTGESRTGKTALVKFFIRCVFCNRLDNETLNPCPDYACASCQWRSDLYGMAGFAYINTREKEVHIPTNLEMFDCTNIFTPAELRTRLYNMSDWDGLRIVYFDEVHRLVRRGMDEQLLKEVEDKSFLWIFSTAKPELLEAMFLNRLITLRTELPGEEETGHWLIDRCEEWGIHCEPGAILRVVQKSNRVVGKALLALSLASIDPEEGLTEELVNEDWNVHVETP